MTERNEAAEAQKAIHIYQAATAKTQRSVQNILDVGSISLSYFAILLVPVCLCASYFSNMEEYILGQTPEMVATLNKIFSYIAIFILAVFALFLFQIAKALIKIGK